MIRAGRVVSLVLVLALLGAGGAAAQEDAADLERRAEARFAADELEAALGLYRQLAERLADPHDKARILVTTAWIEHLAGRDLATVVATLSDALVLDPGFVFQPEAFNPAFAERFRIAAERAEVLRLRAANEAVRRGIERLRAGDGPAARAAFEEALRVVPDHPEALFDLALVDQREGRLEDATDRLQRLVALIEPQGEDASPLRGQAQHNLGRLYRQRGLWADAVRAGEEAVRLLPSDVVAWVDLGLAQGDAGDPAAAAVSLRRAHELAPDDTALVDHLARALAAAGDAAGAVALLEGATRRFPSDARLWFLLGRTRLDLERHAAAEDAFARALEIDPGFAEARANLEVARARRQPAAAPPPPPPGPAPPRPRLGLRFADVDYAALGIHGVMVDAVVAGTAASRAGLEPRDLILKVDGRPVESGEALERYVASSTAAVVVLDLLRENVPRRVELRFE